MLAPHISVVNLGCRVNRVESDRITADLMRLGFAIVDPQDADLIVINTCAVTGEAAGLAGRGPRRDALTQFDECGILVVSADPEVSALLAAHAWEAAFWQRRARLLATTRFLVFGHGSWDQLRAPFFGLCAKAIHRVVDPAWLALSPADRQAEADAWLAAHLADPAQPFGKASLVPLPLLGIPGLTPASECADYYRDTRQFRPRRPSVL